MRPLIALFLFLGALLSCALPQHYEDLKVLHRERGDYILTLSTSTRPQVGKNQFHARLTDTSGRPITDAQVTFYYQMLGMRSIRKRMQTDEGIIYEAEVDLIMGGEWNVSVEIERPHFEKIRENFIIDAGPF